MTDLRNPYRSLIIAVRLCCLFAFAVWLSGCQSTPQPSKGVVASVDSLSASERQSFDEALAQLASGEPKTAEKVLTQLRSARTDVAEIWLNLALSQYQQADYDKTAATLRTMQERFEDIAEPYNLAGLVAVEQGDFKQAEKYYSQAIDLKPTYSNALFNMALLQDVYLQNIASAVEYYERYLALVPDDADTKNWAAGLKMSLNR